MSLYENAYAEKYILKDGSVVRAKMIKDEEKSYIVLNNLGLFRIKKNIIEKIEELPQNFDYDIDEKNYDYTEKDIVEIKLDDNEDQQKRFPWFREFSIFSGYALTLGGLRDEIPHNLGIQLSGITDFPYLARYKYISAQTDFSLYYSAFGKDEKQMFSYYLGLGSVFSYPFPGFENIVYKGGFTAGPVILSIENQSEKVIGYSSAVNVFTGVNMGFKAVNCSVLLKYNSIYDKSVLYNSVGIVIGWFWKY